MLVITRKEREAISIGGDIRVVVTSIGPGKKAVLCVTAPSDKGEPVSNTVSVFEKSVIFKQEKVPGTPKHNILVVVSRIGPGRKIRIGIDAPGYNVRRE